MHTELEKIKAKKEKKIMEYYKSFAKGSGLDKIKDAATSKPITKKRKLRMTGSRYTQKQIVKTAALTKPEETAEAHKQDNINGNELELVDQKKL
jgi:hypothetical protein